MQKRVSSLSADRKILFPCSFEVTLFCNYEFQFIKISRAYFEDGLVVLGETIPKSTFSNFDCN